MSPVPLIEARELSVRDGAQLLLQAVNFHIYPGEIVTVVGPNGSGKTTLLKALIGARRPTAGRVLRAPGLRIGYTPQQLDLDSSMPMTVERFLKLGGGAGRRDRLAALERVEIAALEGAQLGDLSGGELQRVLLARALMRAPALLVLDEPTQGLDQQGEAAFYRLIERMRAETGAAVLMVSHDLHVVMSASDRVICLNGHVCCEGTPADVSGSPEYRALFGLGTQGALALYQHHHDHAHHRGHDHEPAGMP